MANRRWLFPMIILVVAGGMGWWASQREVRRMADIRAFVLILVSPENDTAAPALTSVEPGLPPGLSTSLRLLRQDLLESGRTPEVVVRPGDTEEFGDGTASHVALVNVGGEERLGLRIFHRGKQPTLIERVGVVGYFVPNPSMP